MSALKIVTNISLVTVVLLGMYQISSQSILLADQDASLCCEDGDCKPYKIEDRIHQCSESVGIKDVIGGGQCGAEHFYSCRECIDREHAGQLCLLKESNEYCCEVDPANFGGTCPAEYRYYVNPPCPSLSVWIDGPSQLYPDELGAFIAYVSGGTPPFHYQWYKRNEFSRRLL